MRSALVVLAVLLVVAGCGGTKTVTETQVTTVTHTVTRTATATTSSAAACAGADLTATFAAIPGSAGAGQISYGLRLENKGSSACYVSELPAVQLLGRNGAELPTNASPAQPTTTTVVTLKPGEAAASDARFSPDVPGGSEQTDGPCEPKAFTIRVTIGGSDVDAAVEPPTPVCERGSLFFSSFAAAR